MDEALKYSLSSSVSSEEAPKSKGKNSGKDVDKDLTSNLAPKAEESKKPAVKFSVGPTKSSDPSAGSSLPAPARQRNESGGPCFKP